jgi:hypothetical protein
MHGEQATVSVTQAVKTKPGTPPVLARPKAFPHQGDDWRFYLRSMVARQDQLRGVAAEDPSGVGGSHVGIWYPDAAPRGPLAERELTQPLLKLGHRLEKKLAQTRPRDNEFRLVIVDSWIGGEFHRVREEDVLRLKGKVVDSHHGVSGLLIVRRSWMNELGRHGYLIHPLLPNTGFAVPGRLLDAVTTIDRRGPT